MKRFLTLLLIIGLLVLAIRAKPQGNPDLLIVKFGWSKVQVVGRPLSDDRSPTPGTSNEPIDNPRTKRQSTMRNPMDPKIESTMDTGARMRDLRTLEDQASMSASAGRLLIYYAYFLQVRNSSQKLIRTVYWEFQSAGSDDRVSLIRPFVCRMKIKPQETKDLKALSSLPPSRIITTKNRSSGASERALVNRIDYDDGSIWTRADWNPGLSPEKASEGLASGKCRRF